MGIAIPSKRATRINSRRRGATRGVNASYTELEDSYWREKGGTCRTAVAPAFFARKRKKRQLGAILGQTELTGCGTGVTHIEDRLYFSNVFSAPDMPAILVTCSCVASNRTHCRPAARYLDKHLAQTSSDFHGDRVPTILGYALPVRSVVGTESDVQVIAASDRYAFEFESNVEGAYVWPSDCTLSSFSNSSNSHPLIVAGCPAAASLEMMVHPSSRPLHTIISFNPFHLQESVLMRIQCRLTLLSVPPLAALARCYKPLADLTENEVDLPVAQAPERRLQALGSQNLRDIKDFKLSPRMGPSILHPGPSPMHFGGNTNALERLGRTSELQLESRLKHLEEAVSGGEFGEITAAIKSAEQYADEDIRRVEQRLPADPIGANLIYPQSFNQVVAGPWEAHGAANPLRGSVEVGVSHPGGYGEGAIGTKERSFFFNTGARGTNVLISGDEGEQRVSVGVARKRYGVIVDRSDVERATAVEVRARNADLVTLADYLERMYGQRVGVRYFNYQERAKLDALIDSSPTTVFGGEMALQYKTIGLGVGTNYLQARYGFNIALLGVSVTTVRDFTARTGNLQISWGRGWTVFLENDLPAPDDPAILAAVGVGKPGRVYVALGGGVQNSNQPAAAVNVQTPFTALGAGVLERAAERIAQFSLTVGRFTYLWESVLAPDDVIFG
eukprot:Blabericola_migrator_1__12207@NODE_758_length_6631_cov_135_724863_g542_i0_p1_GENE_NODE_758_length_6631_cov_135_724863_g542_i0NODE_758_length_6631_cov_135_724863_g542_i0_p1_ORF_typecomplete_len675_score54_44Zona_pellucida/PF00100_23/1_8e07_NODE_758_length_6631_cov_135_724863_g542_i043846408